MKEAGKDVTHGSRDEEAIDEHLEGSLVDAEFGSVGLEQSLGVLLGSTLLLFKGGRGLTLGVTPAKWPASTSANAESTPEVIILTA